MEDEELSLEQQQKVKLCRSFRLNKEDAEFVVWNFKHCTINSNQFKSKNSKKGSPMFCCECNQEIKLLDIVCYTNRPHRNKLIYCKTCWGKKYLDTDD